LVASLGDKEASNQPKRENFPFRFFNKKIGSYSVGCWYRHSFLFFVMAGLVPAIHAVTRHRRLSSVFTVVSVSYSESSMFLWMAGSSLAMTGNTRADLRSTLPNSQHL
jgi:hypothetical protein